MPTFSAADIVGKTLIAKKPVALKRLPQKTATTVYTVPAGQTVGVVYSWVQADGALWWMFYDQNQKTYYAIHEPGLYDIGALNAQGTVSLEQVQEDQAKHDNPISYFGDKLLKYVTWGVGLYLGAQLFIDWEKSKR